MSTYIYFYQSVPAKQLGAAESTKTPDSSEDKYTEVVLKVLSSSPDSSRDCFSKLVDCADNRKNAVGLFRELLVGRVSPHSLKILKEERMDQFVEFIEVFRRKFKCDPLLRNFFTPPLDFFADKALIVAWCRRRIDNLRDLEEHTSNFSPEHNPQGLRTYLSESRKIPMRFTEEIVKNIKMIRSYDQLDDQIKENKPQVDQLRNLEGRLIDLFNQSQDFLKGLLVGANLDPETVINQIRDLQHRLRDIKGLAIDLDEHRSIPPLEDMCIDAVLKGRIDSPPYPYAFFSSFVRCSLNCAAKELIGESNYLSHPLRQRCIKNAVDIFYEILRIFPQSEEKRRLDQLIKFIEAFRKKFECDPPLEFPLNPPLDFLANRALMFGWCLRRIDELRDLEEHTSNFSPEHNLEGLTTYLLDSGELGLIMDGFRWPIEKFRCEIRKQIRIIQSYHQRDDRIKDNKSQIDQLENLEGRLRDLFSQKEHFIMPFVEETDDLDPETVINQIQDLQHRIGDIKEMAINLDGVYPPKEGLRERSLLEGESV